MNALVIIDMQVGCFGPETPRYDADGVVARINAVAQHVRDSDGLVIFIQHESTDDPTFRRGSRGWEILPSVRREAEDLTIAKTACDAFYRTELADVLANHGVDELLVTGCATDFCVDTTIRNALSRDFNITVVEDGHTTADRPGIPAERVIAHHNWVWKDLLHPSKRVRVIPAEAVMRESAAGKA